MPDTMSVVMGGAGSVPTLLSEDEEREHIRLAVDAIANTTGRDGL